MLSMPLLILVGLSIFLFGAFLLLTVFEATYGRMGGSLRTRWDRRVARVTFIVAHIDWGAFVKHMVRSGLDRVAHDSAHASLQAIRFVERLLTRAVRSLRERRLGMVTPDVSRQRVSLRETLRKFRKTFARTKEKGK
jgi:hypothetical protein